MSLGRVTRAAAANGTLVVQARMGFAAIDEMAAGLAAIKTGKRLAWDPANEVFTNDDSAMQHMTGTYRDPWQLETFI